MEVKKKRKLRSDRKYKYRKKHGKMQPYFSKRDRNDPLKIWWWKCENMSHDGIMRIPKHLRATALKIVYKPYMRVDVDYHEMSNKSKIEDLAVLTIGLPGEYLLMMFCKRKNKWGVSPVKTARVVIKECSEGLMGVMTASYRLHKYFFWEKRRRKR